jgi:histidinol-phosphatase
MTDAETRLALLEEAVGWAREAGHRTLHWFRTGVVAERKADSSPVTVADREAELFLRDRIAGRFPDDGILGEEFGEARPGARRRWILDPIDGTKSFVRGVPLYGVLLALEEPDADGAPMVTLAVLHFPALDETLTAARGAGAWFNGARARVSRVDRLDEALLLTTSAAPPPAERRPGWDRLAAAAGVVRSWGDAYGHALVATGRAEIMVDPVLAPWDVAPLSLALEEAGGVFTDFDGRSGHRVTSGVATNAALAVEARRLLGVPTDDAASRAADGDDAKPSTGGGPR